MHFEFEHLGTASRFELTEGAHTLGGSDEDAVQLEGLPARLLTLRVEPERLSVQCTQPFHVDGMEIAPGISRLLLPGELLCLSGEMRLRALPLAEATRTAGTQALLRGLLREGAEPPPCRAASLICLSGPDLGRSFMLAEQAQDIGRGAHAHIRLRDRAMSRSHARVRPQRTGFCVEDLGSPNGLYVNGHRLRGEALLAEGDVLELGHTLLRYQAPLEVPSPPPPAQDAGAPGALLVEADVTEPGRARRRALEWWMLGLGAGLAVGGVLVTYALTAG